MKRKLIYAAFFLVILAGLIVPSVYSHKTNSPVQTADRPADVETSGSGASAQAPAGSDDSNAVKPVVPQPDSGLSAGDTAEGKANSTGVAGQGGAGPATQAGAPAAGMEEKGCKVAIAVLGRDGEALFGPADVLVTGKNKWGDTALGALDATGLPYNMKGWSGFVEAVAGQANRGQSGWMYQVNGEIPMVAADQKKIKEGDRVIWWYSKSMGDPVPDWAGLKNNGKG
ncbi:MAG: DUF4430 domain-containing protein [Bacillota bacterium]